MSMSMSKAAAAKIILEFEPEFAFSSIIVDSLSRGFLLAVTDITCFKQRTSY